MPKHVANREDARTYMIDPALVDGFGELVTGSPIYLGGESLIVIAPPLREGGLWKFTAAPALEIGRSAGTA